MVYLNASLYFCKALRNIRPYDTERGAPWGAPRTPLGLTGVVKRTMDFGITILRLDHGFIIIYSGQICGTPTTISQALFQLSKLQ